MDYGQIIILIGYVIGVLITIIYQKEKIKTLRTQIESQSGILSQMERLINIFKIDEVEKYLDERLKKN